MTSGLPCLPNAANCHTKEPEADPSKASKDGELGKHRAPSEAPQSSVFVLRKMVEEVFTVLYSKEPPAQAWRGVRRGFMRVMRCAGEAVGKSSLVPVPYETIQKDPGCVVAHGLPDGVALKKPSEYDTKTLMKILEQSHRIHFTVQRWVQGIVGPHMTNSV